MKLPVRQSPPDAPTGSRWDEGLGFRTIVGELTPGTSLLRLIAVEIPRAVASRAHVQ